VFVVIIVTMSLECRKTLTGVITLLCTVAGAAKKVIRHSTITAGATVHRIINNQQRGVFEEDHNAERHDMDRAR
jgi:hypothetical protein